MAAPITPIAAVPYIPLPGKVQAPESGQSSVFSAVLKQSVASVEQMRTGATESVDRFLSGEGEEVHRVALATQQAELSFDLFMQVRNKVVSAYQDIMRMQI